MNNGTKKVLSLILSAAITVNAGLVMLKNNTSASIPSVTINENKVYLTNQLESGDLGGLIEFHIKEDDGLKLSYYDSNNNETKAYDIEQNYSFYIEANCGLIVDTEYTFDSVYLSGNSGYVNRAMLKNNSTATITGTITCEDNSEIVNYGNFVIDTLMTNEIGTFKNGTMSVREGLNGSGSTTIIEGTGTITATNVYISDGNYSDAPGSVINVIDHFTNMQSDAINATVVAERSTEINNLGGEFTLKIGDASTNITTQQIEKAAYELFDDPEIALNNLPEIYYGQDYDFSDYVSVAEGYDKSLVTFEYSSNGGLEVSDEKPTYPRSGNYYVRAVAPSYGSFLESSTGWSSYKISYLPMEALKEFYGEDEPYLTVTGVTTGENSVNYVGEGITLTVPEGVLIVFPTSSRDALLTPSRSVTLTHDDLFLEGYTTVNQDFEIAFVRESDGATTQASSIVDAVSGIENFVFDSYDPVFFAEVYYSDETDAEISLDQESIAGERLEIVVRDDNLDTVVLTVDGTETNETIEENQCHIELNSVANKAQQVKITATDIAGRVSEAEFKLLPEPIEATISLSAPETIYAGDDYEITVTTNSDATPSITYMDARPDVVVEEIQNTEPPKTAGTYVAFVTLRPTDFYTGTEATIPFSIIKRTPAITFNVPSIYVGDEISPIITTDSDGIEEAYYEFKVKGAEDDTYTDVEPEAAGEYTARVTVPETENYEELTATADFKIDKKPIVATVSVEDPYVGEEYSVDINVTSVGYEGSTDEATIEYKLSTDEDDAYSEDVPTAAGTYTVRVTLPETDVYRETEIEDTFTISKIPITATVSVEDIEIGDEIDPSVETDPETYDGTEITYAFKRSDVAGAQFSTTVPTASGNYIIQVTLPETDAYLGTTCTATFKINKLEAVATVAVEDIYVGETPDPVVTSVSDGKDDATFEYKVSTAADTEYSSTVPTAAGTYSVRATIPATDTYLSLTCENTFMIKKLTTTATVSAADISVGGTVTPVVTTESDGKADASFMYKLATEPEDLYSDTVPTATGTYTVMAIVPETDTYESITCTSEFTISKITTTATVSVADISVGGTVTPVVTTVSDGKADASFEYKLKSDENDGYSATVPAAAGEYTVRATIPETDSYEEITCTADFTISKIEADATVTAADIYVGGTVAPVVTTESDGKAAATFLYKLSTEPDTAYAEEVPTAPGTYKVMAVIPETDMYLGTSCEATFTISKITITATVTVDDLELGDDIVPVISTDPEGYDGTEITYEYKRSDVADAVFSTTVPTAAGNYIVRATLPETDAYLGTTCTATFQISRISVGAEVDFRGRLYYGDTPDPIVTTDPAGYDGTVTFQYKLSTEPDSSYSDTVPVNAGNYIVRATLSETDTYYGTTCTAEFPIYKYSIYPEVEIDDLYYGETVNPLLMEVRSDYDGVVTYAYKLQTDPDTAYSTIVPTVPGDYVCKVTVPDTDNFWGGICSCNFTIFKADTMADVYVDDIYVGEEIEPELDIDPSGYDGTPVYEYKSSAAANTAYSTTVPTAAGEYTVRATIPETETYESTTCTDTFTIKKYELTATVTVNDITYGGTITPVVDYECSGTYNGATATTYVYKKADEGDDAYSATKPTMPGTYVCKATLPETNNCLGTTCTTEFIISMIEGTATVTVADIFVGGTPDPVVETNSDGKDDTSFEYKLSTAEDTAYTATVPTAAGTYTVRATVPATDIYTSATATATFTIRKNTCYVRVTANEINAGDEPDLDIETDSDALDHAVYEYRAYSAPDTAFAEGYPTEAGLYVIRVTVPETDKYLSGSGTCEMQVNRIDVIATISVADIFVGETPNPVITSDSPAKNTATIEYKLASADDSAYSTTVPTAAGTYKVRASLDFTVTYKATTCETTFTISKRDVSASVFVADIVYGGTVNPVVTFVSEDYEAKDQVTYLYAPHDIENPAEFTGDIPTEVGEYSVMAVLPDTDTYYGTEVFAIFNINRQPLDATVSVEDVLYGEEFTVNFTIQGSTTFLPNEYYYFEYKLADAADSAYTTTRPTATGNYVVRLTVLPNGYTEDGVATGTFAIKKLTTTATVSVANIYVGGTVAPVVTTASDGKDDTMFEYKLSTAADTAYSTTVPTDVGTYTVRATVPATLIYNSTTATATFTISKNPVTATVTVADTTVGNDPEPVVTTVSDGTVTYEYKVAGADDSTYSDTIPTAAGTYTVKATVPETAKYLAATATANFTISKNETTATVSVSDITVGNEPEPIVSTVSDGKYLAAFQYKAASADDSAYSDTVPTAAGTYTVKASIPETAKYFATTATANFTISKNVATSEVKVDDILVGGTISPDITTNSDGTAAVEYKAADADDSAYSATLPYVEGKYTVRVTIPETAKYFATSCTTDFYISKSEAGASVSVESIYVGGEVAPVITTESNGKDDTVFEYKAEGADDSTYTTTVPSAAGTYTVRATVPATLEYTKIVCYNSFEIYLNPVTMQKFKVENYFVGQSPKIDFECSSNGEVTYEYKLKTADDSEYTTDEPAKAGIYTVRATVEETAVYLSASFITDFTVSYLNAPQTAFTPAGTAGKNGYFKSDVELTAPNGYKISATENGEYTASIPYTEDLDTIYLRRDDGAKTSAITISDKPKIDKAAPTFNFSTGDVAQDSVMFIPSLIITVDDPNLKSLTLNGNPVDLTAVSGNVLTLSPGWGILQVNIVAEDIAGNVSKINFILKAEWLIDGTIPADQLVPLYENTEYNLADGKWQVIKGNPDDDSVKPEADPTVYNGGLPVYAAKGGDYTVTQVN